MKSNYFYKLKKNQKESFKIKITKSNLDRFIKLSGDNNPIHVNNKVAKKSGFEGRVVHGAYIISQFSKLIGTKLPGKNSLILFTEFKFNNPAYLNKSIEISGTINSKNISTKTIKLFLSAKYKNKKVVATGVALIKII